MIENDAPHLPLPGEMGLTWISGWTGFWVSFGQWLSGDGGFWPWRRYGKGLPRGYPTHAFSVLKGDEVLEAEPGGARIVPLSTYFGRKVLYSKLPLTLAQRDAVNAIGRQYEGVPYNFMDYVYLALWRFRIRPAWLAKRIQGSGREICSQLCDDVLSQVGFHLFDDGRLPQDVTPGDLYSLLEKNGWWSV